ncbi:MAG: alpha-L-fucosidase [Christensenellales bacterium]
MKKLSWKEIDGRSIPEWFDRDKIGIFIHWGLYSVPAYAPRREDIVGSGMTYSEWYEYQVETKFAPYYDFHKKNYGENFRYEDFADMWKAELFNAAEWASLFRRAGAKYIGLVTKHHDGFCLWDSSFSNGWNSVKRGPKRDLVAEILDACEKEGIRRGVYYSLTEWKNDLISGDDYSRYVSEKMIPEMKELVDKFNPEYIFTDGEWSVDSESWDSRNILSYIIQESKVKDTIVFNDRWGNDTRGLHGGVLTSEYGEVNSKAVDEKTARENLRRKKWEECRSISHSFGFNRNENIEHYLTEKELLEMLVDIVSRGGNFIINVAPCADGTISPIIQERLLQLGAWLDVNGEAIYGTVPSGVQNSVNAPSTRKGDDDYLFINDYNFDEISVDTCAGKVELLGYGDLEFRSENGRTVFRLPAIEPKKMPCECIFTVKISK